MPGDARRYLKPGAVERGFGRILVSLIRIGLIRGHFYVLEVRGRKSGRKISLPVDPLDLDRRRYLVCARGDSNWVRNARSAGEIVLVRAMRRGRYCGARTPPRPATTGSQSLPRPLRDRSAALLSDTKGIVGGSLQ
jgi:hypothetical protein